MEKNFHIKLTNSQGVDAIAQIPLDLDDPRFKGIPEKLIAKDLVDAINRDPGLSGKIKAEFIKQPLKLKINLDGKNGNTRTTGEQENNS